jgi:hypothetical protein
MVLFLLTQALLIFCSSASQEQCGFNYEGRLQACGAEINTCYRIRDRQGGHRSVLLISNSISDFHDSYYDVHAYRLCNGQQPSVVTLADAIRGGELCQMKIISGIFREITFQGCHEYFYDGSSQDLTIYAYEDVNGCNGDLLYRFLLINGTGRDHSYVVMR